VGGDSFLGTVLLGEIERAFGETLSLSVLLDCRTVRGLARRLAPPTQPGAAGRPAPAPGTTSSAASGPASAPPPDPCLVPIRATGSRPPLFMVHGLHCDVVFAAVLAGHLDPAQPLYAFQGLGLAGNNPPFETVDAMAGRYIESLRRVQPRGPYLLSGFCVGGLVALEIAQRLVAGGEAVDGLFLIDTPATLIPEVTDGAVARAVRIATNRLELYPDRRKYFLGAPRTLAAFGQALKAYRPKPYSGWAQVLTTEAALERMGHPDLGWPKYLRLGTEIRVVAPTRESIVQHNMAVVGRYLTEALAAAGRRGPHGRGPVDAAPDMRMP
jgi:thioesterase domain-containing protein